MTTCRAGRAVLLLAVFLVLFQTGSALAKETDEADLPERRAIAWTNPILFVFTWYMAEVEIRLQDNHTVGISGSFLQTDDGDKDDPLKTYEEIRYSSFNVFYRYYPDESFKGFFIGAQFGASNVKREAREEALFSSTLVPVDESGSAMLAGVLLGYGWLLGDAQRIGVSIGIGANRLFGDDVPDDALMTLPVVRLINVGVAF